MVGPYVKTGSTRLQEIHLYDKKNMKNLTQ
jgi:hypothetical protein